MPLLTEAQALDALLYALSELDASAQHTYNVLKSGERTRTYCGGKWYKTGFAPCELRYTDEKAAQTLNLPDCQAVLSQRRVAVKRAARVYSVIDRPETFLGGSM